MFRKYLVCQLFVLLIFHSLSAQTNERAVVGPAEASSTHSPSPGKAFLLSLVLPGIGEYYGGSRKMAAVFLGTEIALWAGLFSCRYVEGWYRDDAVSWAGAHANIDMSGRSSAYFVAVENYISIRDYNEAKLQQRNLEALYPEDNQHSWEWDSDRSRKKFEDLRVSSDTWKQRSLFVIGGIVLNHIVSSIDAVRVVKGKEKSTLQMGVTPLPGGGGVFHICKRF